MASQLEFVPIDIDMADDPKVSYLMDTVGAGDAAARFAAYGRLVLVMQRVYHDGFYLSYGKFERIKLAKDAGTKLSLTEAGSQYMRSGLGIFEKIH